MNILITGGFGFVGSHLSNILIDRGHDVTILSRSENTRGIITSKSYKTLLKDITEISERDIENIDVVYHCASTVHNHNIFDDVYIDANVNIIGTLALLEACKNIKPKIIYTSTFFATNPIGLYSATKLCAENILNTFKTTCDMDIIITRLTNVYGVGESGVLQHKAALNRLIYTALKNESEYIIYNGGEMIRDYIYVTDVAYALVCLLNVHVDDIIYIGTGKSIKYIDIANIVCKLTGYSKLNIQPITNMTAITDFECDVSPLKLLGWTPKVEINDGIQMIIDKYNEEFNEIT